MPKILPMEKFAPVQENNYKKLYDPARTKLVLKKIHEFQSYGVKMWTSKSGTEDLGSLSSNKTFFILAQQQCPMNVRLLGENKHF